jgi:hypothetical protein
LKKTKKRAAYIAAQPGFHTVELIGQIDDDGEVEKHLPFLRPIIGWEIITDGAVDDMLIVQPITVEGLDTWNPIVYPDGRVEKPLENDWADVAEWAEYELESRRKMEWDKGEKVVIKSQGTKGG